MDFNWPIFWILAVYIEFEFTKNVYVLLVLIWALKDGGGSWLEFGILILILIWSQVFDTPINQILALYVDFEGRKNIHVI